MPPVRIYTTPLCPYCLAAKRLLRNKGVEFAEIDVSETSEREKMIALANGRHTVPQVFVGERHVGGFDDLSALDKAGELDPLLAGRAPL